MLFARNFGIRYREALEYCEQARTKAYDDRLKGKLELNFRSQGTMEFMQSIATKFDTQIIVYSVVTQYALKDANWTPLDLTKPDPAAAAPGKGMSHSLP